MKNRTHCKTARTAGGATVMIMGALISIALTMFAFFTAEVWHANVVRIQLRNACDAAGLATAAALASSSYPSILSNTTKIGGAFVPANELRQARINAANVGMQVFKNNTVCGQSLAECVVVDDAETAEPPDGKVVVSVDYYAVKDDGSLGRKDATRGKHIVYHAAIRTRPLFGIPIFGEYFTIRSQGRSASAIIDLAFCLDNSLSMAVDTLRYSVQRKWQPDTLSIAYLNPVPADRFPNKNPGKVPTYYHGKGCTVPFGLDGDDPRSGICFNSQLFGPNEAGSYPGNYYQPSLSIKTDDFTDVIVMPSGKDGQNPSGITIANDALGTFLKDGSPITLRYTYKDSLFVFPNVATMVEAQRGNLDNDGSPVSMYLKDRLHLQIKARFREAYEAYALSNIEPFHSEAVQVSNFFALLDANTDTHFCFVPFSNHAGTASPGTYKQYRIGKVFDVPAGNAKFDFPYQQVPLNKTNTQADEVNAAIGDLHLYGGTCTGDGLAECVDNLLNGGQTRLGARRVTILLSDGEPTDSPDVSYGCAEQLGEKGIPIFPIAFVHGSEEGMEDARLFMDTVAGSCRRKGGVGSQSFVMSPENMTQLQLIFRQVAHQIVTLE